MRQGRANLGLVHCTKRTSLLLRISLGFTIERIPTRLFGTSLGDNVYIVLLQWSKVAPLRRYVNDSSSANFSNTCLSLLRWLQKKKIDCMVITTEPTLEPRHAVKIFLTLLVTTRSAEFIAKNCTETSVRNESN